MQWISTFCSVTDPVYFSYPKLDWTFYIAKWSNISFSFHIILKVLLQGRIWSRNYLKVYFVSCDGCNLNSKTKIATELVVPDGLVE